MTDISLSHVTKRFGASEALRDVSLDLASGSFTALLGPSGCGKTTLLRLVAGFEAPSEGEIRFGADLVADPHRQAPPETRGVGVVFQSYALWPHMSVFENVAYPLRTRRLAKAEIPGRVEAVLETVGLAGFGERRIEALSGGQRQRVALARCLVADARAILFDEPLANLDMHLRGSMAAAFREIHERTGATMVYVTHDQSEALALADRVVVMERGRILQCDPPGVLYCSPSNAAVAGFVGRGSLVAGTASGADGGRTRVRIGGHEISARGAGSGQVRVLLRPENLRPAAEGIAARVVGAVFRGPVHETELSVEATGERLLIDLPEAAPAGSALHVAVLDAWIVPERADAASPDRPWNAGPG